MKSELYKPEYEDYFYRAEIYQEALLTLEQKHELEWRQKPCTSDPEDSTEWGAIDWHRTGRTSFANKDWNEFIQRLREHFKRCAPMITIPGEWLDEHYVLYMGNVIGLEGKYLLREKVWIQRAATVKIGEKFMKDLTLIGRWESQ